MPVVMVVEDEHMLRAYTVRALGRLPEIDVVEAANYAEASELLREMRPNLMVSDIGLPDRNSLGLLTEIDSAGMHIPVVFVTAYLGDYRERIPNRAGIEVFEKPVSMGVLTDTVQRLLAESQGAHRAPFSVTEYLQLAAMGRHTVMIRVIQADEQLGWARIQDGELWSARVGELSGMAAVNELLFATNVRVEVETADGMAGEREVTRPLEALLLDAFRRQDEARRAGKSRAKRLPRRRRRSLPPDELPRLPRPSERKKKRGGFLSNSPLSALPPSKLSTPPPPPPPEPEPEPAPPSEPDDGFAQYMEEGLDALLVRDYHLAWRAFTEAKAIRPDHPVVRANLFRIRQMGHAPLDDD